VEIAPAEPVEPKAKPKRKPLPDHLDRVEQVLSAGEDCPECGGVSWEGINELIVLLDFIKYPSKNFGPIDRICKFCAHLLR